MCSFYRNFCITGAVASQKVCGHCMRALHTGAVARLTALVAAHCNSKESFEGRYEQL